MGTLTSWNPLGHSRPVTGLLYLYLYFSWNVEWPHDVWGTLYLAYGFMPLADCNRACCIWQITCTLRLLPSRQWKYSIVHIKVLINLRDFSFPQRCGWGFRSVGMWRCLWASCSRQFEGKRCVHPQGQSSPRITIFATTHHHIPQALNTRFVVFAVSTTVNYSQK